MKNSQSKILFAALGLGLTLTTSVSHATKAKDLALECVATYKVHESKDYWIPAHYRVPDQHGTTMLYEILNLEGKDCQKLKDHYGMNIVLNQKLGETNLPNNAIFLGVNPKEGQILKTAVTQQFKYQTDTGELPLFPMVHSEEASLLGYSGQANSKALYNTPTYASLSDQQKLSVLDTVMVHIQYGKVFTNYNDSSSFLDLLLNIDVTDLNSQKEYLQDLLLVISNIQKKNHNFTTLSPGKLVAQKINQLLYITKGTQWAPAIEVYQTNPVLFHSQVVQWAFLSDMTKAPVLNAAEVESFLSYALETSINLKKVNQLLEARILLNQYQEATKVILYFSGEKKHIAEAQYDLTEKSKELIQQILGL